VTQSTSNLTRAPLQGAATRQVIPEPMSFYSETVTLTI